MNEKLVVQAPGGQRHELPLTTPIFAIGRGRACDLVLDYGYVSRVHARLEQSDAGYMLVDCESTNGIYVNGQRVQGTQPLAAGDQIAIADILITFLDSSSDVTATTVFRAVPAGCPIRCDSASWQVWIGDELLEARLSLQEFEILSLLASRYGTVCTREELGAAVWGEGNYDYNILHRLVHRVKQKLGAERAGLIVSVPGLGYKIGSL